MGIKWELEFHFKEQDCFFNLKYLLSMEDIEHKCSSEREEIDQKDWDEKNRKILQE